MHNKRLIIGILCVCVFCSGLFGQSEEDWYYDKEIKGIEFIGLKSIDAFDLDSIVSSFLGEKFSDEIYAEILNRIYALEYFDDVIPVAVPADPQRQTVILEFTVVERPIVTSLVFSGNSQIRTTELRDVTSVKASDIYASSRVALDERKIRDLYFQKGYTNVKISSETSETEDGIKITFNIDEGRSTVIATIDFQGNVIASAQSLKKDLQLKEVGLFQKGAFQETLLEQDKQAILLFYQDKGYIDAVIENVVQESVYNEDKSRDELTLTFVINEGRQYLFNGLTLEGNVIFSTEELVDLVKLKKGDVFNQTRFQEGIKALADLYYSNGYTENNFMPEMDKNTEDGLIGCVLHIIENPRGHIESISIVGNDRTKDFVILREMLLEPGDIFSIEKFSTSLSSLISLGFFSAIVPEINTGSEENLIDLVINVEEGSTIGLEFGVTFSGITDPDSWPASLYIKWSDTNFLGTGKNISAEIRGTNDEQSVSFNYGDSWFLGLPVTFNAGFYVRHSAATALYNNYFPTGVNTTNYYMDYNQFSFGLNAALGNRWVWHAGRLIVQGGISNSFLMNFYDADLFEPVDTTISDRHGKIGVENTIWAKTAFDSRDLPSDPSTGLFASQQLSWTGLIPELESEFFLRSDTKGELYFTLLDHPLSETWNLKFVLAGYTGFSFLTPAFGTPISSLNELGIDGMFNGRGWGQTGKDQSYDVTGKAQWSSFLELRMPLAAGVFSLDFFMDAIAIKDTPQEMFTSLTLDDFYFSFGPSMRFAIPQFPLRLLWVWSFKFENGQFEWNSNSKNVGSFVLSFNLTNQ